MNEQQTLIMKCADSITNDLLHSDDEETVIDPITMMLIATLINMALQILIKYIQQKCKKGEDVKKAIEKPGIFTKWIVARAIRKAEYNYGKRLNSYGIKSYDASQQILTHVGNLSPEMISFLITKQN